MKITDGCGEFVRNEEDDNICWGNSHHVRCTIGDSSATNEARRPHLLPAEWTAGRVKSYGNFRSETSCFMPTKVNSARYARHEGVITSLQKASSYETDSKTTNSDGTAPRQL